MIEVDDTAWEKAKAMLADGRKWSRISMVTGISVHRLRAELDPGWQERRREQHRQWSKANAYEAGHGAQMRVDAVRISPDDARRALASVPRDTRGFTARVMGDPLPGRSALDRMGQ